MNVLVFCDIFRTQEQNAEQLTSVKAEHQREIQRLLASRALEHSSSKVAELTNQVNTQEVVFYELKILSCLCLSREFHNMYIYFPLASNLP